MSIINRLIYFALGGVLVCGSTGCRDYVEVSPIGRRALVNTGDYQQLLYNANDFQPSASFPAYTSDDYGISDANFETNMNTELGAAYSWAVTFVGEKEDQDWARFYKQIYVCNQIIEGVPGSIGGTTAQKERIRAEALVHRAYAYLTLVNSYARHYSKTTAATDPGVPVLLKPDLYASLHRASVQAVYDQVKADLEAAIPALPDQAIINMLPSATAAYGLLARASESEVKNISKLHMLKSRSSRSAWLLSCAMLAASLHVTAQKRKGKDKDKAAPSAEVKADTTAKKPEPPKLKKYSEVITKDMVTSKGFITVHSKEDEYYFEVPFSLMGKDILIVNRVAEASVDMRNGIWGLVGDDIGQGVYRFEKARGNKLFLRRISFTEYTGDSTKAMYASVQKNNVQAIAAVFPIVAYNADSTGAVLNMKEFLESDNDVLYFSKQAFKDRAGMGAQQNDRSYIKYVHPYATNLEVRAFKTYSAGRNPTSSNYSVELNSSMVLLPETPLRPRLQDKRVGYFSVTHRDFDAHPQGVTNTSYAIRWRLEPKPEDVEKYKRGELVEPAKPIVFYIDPVTPKKWVPYLIQGVNDWRAAFEKAGFKNAIYAREAPSREEDSTWSLEDARHSAIVYRPSIIANAMGPSVTDPRSGEILESHVFWYHNVMSLLQKWYFVQCAAVDTGARKLVFDDKLMGELIRFVSSHEVGHALGLSHNFGSSSTVPVENLRNKAWVEKYGHTPSIMDYARFNYVAQPEDNISRAGLFPRINDYDKWAIEWAYKWRPGFKDEWEEQKVLTAIVTDSLKNKRLWFGNEMEPLDPRSQNEDLGDDAVKASTYGIMNLKRIIKHLGEWTNEPEKDATNMREMLSTVFNQYATYVGHVMKLIGGQYHYEKIGSQPGPAYEAVEYKRQKAAMAFLDKEFFTIPEWLNEKPLMDRIPDKFGIDLTDMQRSAMNGILNRMRLTSMLAAQYDDKVENPYTVEELLQDMDKIIFKELYAGKSVSFYRRNLQKIYINKLLDMVYPNDDMDQMFSSLNQMYTYYQTDVSDVLKAALAKEQQLIARYQADPRLDKETQRHLKELNVKIKKMGEKDLRF